jgi:aerobic-type carbon monoxide dehydrogenase small subunit (CoxS/CutS family)
MVLELSVNGVPVRVDMEGADEYTPLLAVLREALDLTGAKYGCGEGECGACTVLVDGEAVRSCVTPTGSVSGKDILTIEGLERAGVLHPLQQAFLDHGAFQCGFCTPGMIMSALALLDKYPDPDEDQIVDALQGNICRCGTYRRIVRAVQQAAAELQASGTPEPAGAGEVAP